MNDLIRALENPDEAERIYAVQDIVETNQSELAAHLINKFLTETSQAVKDAILFGLKNLSCSACYDQLFEMFHSSDAYLRNAAVSIFGSGREDALIFLTSRIEGADREVRKLILDSLFEIGTPQAVVAIRKSLNDHSVNVKITAIEYLGRLEDRESLNEMIALLQKESEPMLRTAILDSLSLIGTDSDIMNVLSILGYDRNISQMDPLYIPEVIRLAAQAGDMETVCNLLDSIEDFKLYANDIIYAIEQARRRFKEDFMENRIFEKLIVIAKDMQIQEDTRNAAVKLLLEKGGGFALDNLEILGNQLIKHESMIYAGVRLIALSGKKSGKKKIMEIMKKTKDEELRELCEELLEGIS